MRRLWMGRTAAALSCVAWVGLAWAQTPLAPVDPQSTLANARVQERSILGQLAMIDGQLQTLLGEMDALREEITTLEEQRTVHARAVEEADNELAQLELGVQGQVRSLYRVHRMGLLQVIFGAEGPVELRRRGRYLTQLLMADVGRLRDYTTVRDQRKAALDALDADRGRLTELRGELEDKDLALRDQRAERMEMLRKVREDRELALQVMSEMDRARADLDVRADPRLYEARATPPATDAWAGGFSGGNGQLVPSRPSTASTFRSSFGRLPWPVRGRLVRRYGPSVDPVTGQRATSNGIDIAADFGEPVRAVYRGVVRVAGMVKGFGQTVIVQHGPYMTVYAHLSGIRVRVDDTVTAGQVVGLVGNTGLTSAEGHRLTFEVRYNQAPQDPLPWLAQ